MMKKNGFTLAEVLITLAIIGVVATLTLPALMTNTGEQQYVTGFKKGINTLTEAAQMNEAISGFNYATLAVSSDITQPDEQSLYGLLANRASVDFIKTGNGENSNGKVHNLGSSNYTIFFRDGSALFFDKTSFSNGDAANIEADGMPKGISVVYDVNGLKGPNTLSNCNGTVVMFADSSNNDSGNMDACDDKTKRMIRDQFGVRLRSGIAVPNGRASKWAFNR